MHVVFECASHCPEHSPMVLMGFVLLTCLVQCDATHFGCKTNCTVFCKQPSVAFCYQAGPSTLALVNFLMSETATPRAAMDSKKPCIPKPVQRWWAGVYCSGPPDTGHSGFISDDDWEIPTECDDEARLPKRSSKPNRQLFMPFMSFSIIVLYIIYSICCAVLL